MEYVEFHGIDGLLGIQWFPWTLRVPRTTLVSLEPIDSTGIDGFLGVYGFLGHCGLLGTYGFLGIHGFLGTYGFPLNL